MDKKYLWEKAGLVLQHLLTEPELTEITLNDDGQLWAQHCEKGNVCIGEMSESHALGFVHAVAGLQNKYLNEKTPYCDSILPFHGERINITIPPVATRPTFSIRKKAYVVYTLAQYCENKIITHQQKTIIEDALKARKNIIVSGGPASGKTTLTNALLHSLSTIADDGQRILLLQHEDELQCSMQNKKSFFASPTISMNTLLWLAMRNSPERIIVGEVRDGSAYALLKAWNTGCPGGIATLHANNAETVLQRLLDLSQEAISIPPYSLVAEAVDIIVHITASHHDGQRRVTDIVAVNHWDREAHQFSLTKLDSEGANHHAF